MDNLIDLLQNQGPQLGKELVPLFGHDPFAAWKYCAAAKNLEVRIIGRRYLRLDAKVEGYARLSPSIMREFLNYTVIGLAEQQPQVNRVAGKLQNEIVNISNMKKALAAEAVSRLLANHSERAKVLERSCFIIAGDVVFNMSHAEPRPESSTGELVKGSDLDIICVTEDLSPDLQRELDDQLYREKYNLLVNPAVKEELDYIIKDIALVKDQLLFDNFRNMVASKILDEGHYLSGSEHLFVKIKDLVGAAAVPEKIRLLQLKAEADRFEAERELLESGEGQDREQLMALFYTTEEKEEIF